MKLFVDRCIARLQIQKEMGGIANNWKIYNGVTHWLGLLDSPPSDFRTYINHYGEMAEATYDAYIKTPVSKNAGNCRFSRKNLFDRCGILRGRPLNQYKVTKYIYATSAVPVPGAFVTSSSTQAWSKKSNWIGFIAVATDEGKKVLGRRDIMIVWRGTVNPSDMVHDAELVKVSAKKIFGEMHLDNPKVHMGWYSIYTTSDPNTRYNQTSARDQALAEVKKLVDEYREEETSLTITGHSMGAAVGTLNAIDIVFNGINKQAVVPPRACLVTMFAFACPKVGDANFQKVFNSQTNLHCLRINNALDIVPKYPMVGYSDVGHELGIDTTKSTYLKTVGDPVSWHSMEGYMHGVAGTQGIKGGFKLEINRDLSLINKYSGTLKDEYGIPSSWWTEKHNGMVQNDNGNWELNDREVDDDQ
ncbi:phospholipase A1-II 1-like [Lactuca sativa]|nr:phospholipase A1-II 1-like [Lactuca sativa]